MKRIQASITVTVITLCSLGSFFSCIAMDEPLIDVRPYNLDHVDWNKETSELQKHIKPELGFGVQAVIDAGIPCKIEEINRLRVEINNLNPDKPQLPMLTFDRHKEHKLAITNAVLGKAYPPQEMAKLILSPKLAEIKRLLSLIRNYATDATDPQKKEAAMQLVLAPKLIEIETLKKTLVAKEAQVNLEQQKQQSLQDAISQKDDEIALYKSATRHLVDKVKNLQNQLAD